MFQKIKLRSYLVNGKIRKHKNENYIRFKIFAGVVCYEYDVVISGA
jgi:hypothetical protein